MHFQREEWKTYKSRVASSPGHRNGLANARVLGECGESGTFSSNGGNESRAGKESLEELHCDGWFGIKKAPEID